MQDWTKLVRDPIRFARYLWPDVTFYSQQEEIIYSVMEDSETIVPAGNMLGKDFVTGFVCLWFFMTRVPCKVVTTSADYSQLENVLWGEIRNFIRTARYPLDATKGGPLLINHLHIRRVANGQVHPNSYLLGRTAERGEMASGGLLGHHVPDIGDGIPRNLFVCDEASAVDDPAYTAADTWAARKLIIGNPFPCRNFFYRAVKGGNLEKKLVLE